VGAAVRYHPGHYVWIGGSAHGANLADAQTTILSQIVSMCGNTNIQGVEVMAYWAILEGPAKDAWKDTFLDAVLTQAKACNKRVSLHIAERLFGGYTNLGTYYFPSYLNATAYNGGWVEKLSSTASAWNVTAATRMWEQPVMDRLIELTKHICQRYETNTTIGPYLEMIHLGETVLGVPSSSPYNYTNAAMMAQEKRWMDAVRPACPQTAFRLPLNYTGRPTAETIGLIQYAIARDIAVGGPDPELPLPLSLPTINNGQDKPRTIVGNELWRGNSEISCTVDGEATTCWNVGGNTDFRNTGVWVAEQQALGYQGLHGFDESPQEILTYQVGTMRARYMVWMQNTYQGTDSQKWANGILPTINANLGKVANNSGAYTAPASVPCLYASGCKRD
jgi:hypothetical protein